jgi:hypothetical protein
MFFEKIHNKFSELPYGYKLELIAIFFASIAGSLTYASMMKITYSSVAESTLSLRLIIESVIGCFFAGLWITEQKKLFSIFVPICLLEIVLYIGIIIYMVITRDFDTYIIFTTLIAGFVSNLVSGGSDKIHEMITDVEEYRVNYKYFRNIYSTIGMLIGGLISFFFHSPLWLCGTGLAVSLTLYNLTDIVNYQRIQKL